MQRNKRIMAADGRRYFRTEEQLHESEAPFRELAQNIDEVFWVSDAELQSLVYINPAYERVWGRSCESLREDPRSFLDAIHPQDLPRVLDALKARTDVPSEVEYRIIRPDGSVRWISDRSFPIRSQAGNIYRFGGIARDITRSKQAEEQLATHRAQLEEAQALAGLGNWTWDIPTGTLNWSDELYRRFGREPKEFTPTYEGSFELVHPEDRGPTRAAIESALSGQRPYDCEVRIVRTDGSLRVLHTRGRVIFDQQGKPLRMTGMAQDITEIKQAQAALQQTNEQLHRLSRRLFEVQEDERRHLARELHDHIGQALTAAKINLESARRLQGRDAIVRRLDDGLAIIEGLLQQVRQLSLELRPPLLDDLGLVQALRWYLDQQEQTSGLLIEFFGDPELGCVDAAIQTACFRVAQEAVTNVLRHARAHKVNVELRRALESLHLVVRDDGIGFDVAAAQQRAERGESLGLLGMRERVALMGGELDFESEPGRGTTVHAFLPVSPRANAQDPTS